VLIILIVRKISRFLFGGSGFSSYLCRRLQDDSKLSGKASVIAYGFWPQAFFMPNREKCFS
jgi:hypothetical protein